MGPRGPQGPAGFDGLDGADGGMCQNGALPKRVQVVTNVSFDSYSTYRPIRVMTDSIVVCPY
jgi:hypothetical protein